jgi:lysophospholipase L1-like esterase
MPNARSLPPATLPLAQFEEEAIWADQVQADGTTKTVRVTLPVRAATADFVINAGTLAAAAIPAGTLMGNAGTTEAAPAPITLGANLAFTNGTLSATSPVKAVGTDLALSNDGTVSIAALAAHTLLANPGTATAAPVAVPLDATLAFNNGTLGVADALPTVGAGTLFGNSGTVAATPGELAVGANLVLSNGTLAATVPVASVAGKAGAVTLAHTDITDWTAATTGLAGNLLNSTLKALARAAESNNPVINAAAAGVTVSWVLGVSLDASLTQVTQYFASAGVTPHPEAFVTAGGPASNPTAAGLASTAFFPASSLFPNAGPLNTWFPAPSSLQYFQSLTWRTYFMTDAPVFEARMTPAGTPATNVHVLVDGKYATPAGGLVPGANGAVRVDFAGVRKPRLIEICSAGASGFRCVNTGPLDSVYAPAFASDPQIVFDGDSFSESDFNQSPVDPDGDWTQQLARRLGWRLPRQLAVASTGWLNSAAGARSTLRFRLENGGWLDANPSALVVASGYNDVTLIEAAATNNAAVVAEMTLYLLSVRNIYPNLGPVFILGPWSGRRGPDAPTIALEQAMQAGVTAIGNANNYFVPVSTPTPKPWQFGTGNTGATNGTGNSDLTTGGDGTHPSVYGHIVIAERAAAEMRPLIYALK